MSLACCVKCQRRGQREPNCDGARSNCNVVCVDCTWPCATLVAVTMCGTAEATKDHLNEHSLCYSSQLGSQAPSRDRSTRAESGLCRVSVVCQLWQYYATQPHGTRGRVLTGLSEAALTPGHLLVGDVQCSIWPMTPVEPSAPPVSVTRVGRVMALRKRNQTQQAEKNQNFKYHFHIPLSHTTAEINQKVVYTTFFREM